MKAQLVTAYRISHLQRYGVTVLGNVTGVYPPLVVIQRLRNIRHALPQTQNFRSNKRF